MLDFPNPPLTNGQTWTGTNGARYVWDGTKWVLSSGGPFLPLNGPLLSNYANDAAAAAGGIAVGGLYRNGSAVMQRSA